MAFSINGVGRTYYGQRDFESDGSFVTTKWFIFVFIPISPAHSARVRVVESGGPLDKVYEIIEELPVCWTQVFQTYAFVAGFCSLLYVADELRWSGATLAVAMVAWAVTPFVRRRIARRRAGLV